MRPRRGIENGHTTNQLLQKGHRRSKLRHRARARTKNPNAVGARPQSLGVGKLGNAIYDRGELMDWKELFYDLLDEVEQIPHPMAEQAWDTYNKLANGEGEL